MSFLRQQVQDRLPMPRFFSVVHRHWLWGFLSVLGLTSIGLMLFFPLYREASRLEAEKEAWQAVAVQPHTAQALVQEIPGLEQLPAVIEACRSVFQEEGIEVSSLNVERMVTDTGGSAGKAGTSSGIPDTAAATPSTGTPGRERATVASNDSGALLDYALVHLRWQGSWSGIEQGLARLESHHDFRIRVEEVSLKPGGGEGVVQIYFRVSEL